MTLIRSIGATKKDVKNPAKHAAASNLSISWYSGKFFSKKASEIVLAENAALLIIALMRAIGSQ